MSLFGNFLDKAQKAVTQAAQSAVQAVKSTVTTVTNALSTAVTRAATAIKNTVATVASAAQNVLSGVARGVAGLVGAVSNLIGGSNAGSGNTSTTSGGSGNSGRGTDDDDHSDSRTTTSNQSNRSSVGDLAGQPANTRVDYRTPITNAPYGLADSPQGPQPLGLTQADLHAAAKGTPLAQDVLLALTYEGKSDFISDEQWLNRFARFGWDERETAQARYVLSLWKSMQRPEAENVAVKQAVAAELRHLLPPEEMYRINQYLQSYTIDDLLKLRGIVSPLGGTTAATFAAWLKESGQALLDNPALAEGKPFASGGQRLDLLAYQQLDKQESVIRAVNTLEVLQNLVEDYPIPPESGNVEGMVAYAREYQLFAEKYGVTPQHVTWFASDQKVTLEELIVMDILNEGGTTGLPENPDEIAVWLANRYRNYMLGTQDRIVSREDYGIGMTVQELLDAYNSDDKTAKDAAGNIIRNIFGYDQSFYAATSLGSAWSPQQLINPNLVRDPRTISPALGDRIIALAEGAVDREKWDNDNDRRLIDGQLPSDQARFDLLQQQLSPPVFAEKLETLGLGKMVIVPTIGGDVYFLNRCQSIVRMNLNAANLETILRDNGCIK